MSMEQQEEKLGIGCIVSLIAIPVFLVALFIGNDLIQAVAMIAGSLGLLIESIKAIIAKENSNKKSNDEIVKDLLEREYKKKEDDLKRELETKTAALKKWEKV